MDSIQLVVGPVFGEFDLIVNVDKTERTVIGHSDLVTDQSAWRKTRKLGSLLGTEEDVDRRIVAATQAFKGIQVLWGHRDQVTERVRLHSYRAIVESVLLYNSATWALNEEMSVKLDRTQRRMLRQVIGVRLLDKMTDAQLYERCGIKPASIQVLDARWRMFGHTLRMHENTPARRAMAYYFDRDQKGRQGNRVTIASALSKEYESVTGKCISSRAEYDRVVAHAQDRDAWKHLVGNIVSLRLNKYKEKADARHEARRAKALASVATI